MVEEFEDLGVLSEDHAVVEPLVDPRELDEVADVLLELAGEERARGGRAEVDVVGFL